MPMWRRLGKSIVSTSYFLILLLLFTYIAVQGPLVNEKVSLSAQSILRDTLFPFSRQELGLSENPSFALMEFYVMIFLGFLSAYLMSRTFQRLFELGVGMTLLITLIFLSPYYSPLLFGVPILDHGYAYPLFLLTVRCLLRGFVLQEPSEYIKFFLFSAVAIITRRQFIFLPVMGGLTLLYALRVNGHRYFGKKIFLGVAFLLSFLLPDLSEKYMNYRHSEKFVSLPFAGFQLAVTPLYISSQDDGHLFENEAFKTLLSSLRDPLAQEGLLDEVLPQEADTPFMLKVRTYFESYEKIAYEHLHPIIQTVAAENPALVDEALMALSLTLIYHHFPRYFLIYSHNIIDHLGGYFMFGLLVLVFAASLKSHLQQRGTLSLAALTLSGLTFSNYCLVALLEPVTQAYGFYTDALFQALLLSLMVSLFRKHPPEDMKEESMDKGAFHP